MRVASTAALAPGHSQGIAQAHRSRSSRRVRVNLVELVVTLIELYCDHSECAAKTDQIIETAANVVEARKLIDARRVRCPVHGVRAAPLQVGRVSGANDPFD